MRVIVVPISAVAERRRSWSVVPLFVPPTHAVLRLGDDDPVPPDSVVVERGFCPEVSDAEMEAARRAIAAVTRGPDSLRAEVALGIGAEARAVRAEVEAAKGLPHPYTWLAPLSTQTLADAAHMMAEACDLWASPCSSAVVRVHAHGYQVWTGVGSFLSHVGVRTTYEEAEQLAVSAVRAERKTTMAKARRLLAGWADETPYYTATLATAEVELPISVRRGPMTSKEVGSSWDLPVVAVYRGAQVERHDDRVTWDDERSRAAVREKQLQNARDAQECARRAVAVLAEHPALKALARDDHLAQADIKTSDGVVKTVGPVRWREDGQVPLALVEKDGGWRKRRCWMALKAAVDCP